MSKVASNKFESAFLREANDMGRSQAIQVVVRKKIKMVCMHGGGRH